MGSLSDAAKKMCDDCSRVRPLRWFGRHIRVCEPCRNLRIETNRLPVDLAALSKTQASGDGGRG